MTFGNDEAPSRKIKSPEFAFDGLTVSREAILESVKRMFHVKLRVSWESIRRLLECHLRSTRVDLSRLER